MSREGTIPILFPIVIGLDYCMIVYIISSMAKDTPTKETFIGISPFLVSDLLRNALQVLFPGLAPIALKL